MNNLSNAENLIVSIHSGQLKIQLLVSSSWVTIYTHVKELLNN